jgi:hypothetical protein
MQLKEDELTHKKSLN